MSPLTFSLKSAPSQRLDLSKLTPDRLKDMKPAEIQRIAVGATREPLLVGDIFALKGRDAAEIRFEGGSDRLDFLGHGMEKGVIRVDGDVGFKAGRRMRGGEIEVRGNAGPWLGSQMSGGRITISANAGDSVGGPVSGELAGIGRLSSDPDRIAAEYGLIVRTDLQGQGLGKTLLSRIVDFARAEGIGRVEGMVLAENDTMLSICRQLGFGVKYLPDDPGIVRVSLDLR